MLTTKFCHVVAALAIATGWANSAAAQDRSARVYRGLFGEEESPSPQRLDFSLDLGEAYDDNVLAELSGVRPDALQASGFYTMLVAAADYQHQGERLHLGLTGSSALRYYGNLHEVRSASHSAGAGLSAVLGPRTTMMLNATAAYSPSSLYSLFPTSATPVPGDAIAAAPDYRVNASESYAYGAMIGATRELGPRSTVSVTGNFQYTDFLHESVVRRDRTNYGIRGEYSHKWSRHNTVRLSYRHRRGELGYGSGAQSVEHGVDAGLQFARPLSATRNLTFGFSLGSSMIDVPASSIAGAIEGRRYGATGTATLQYDFGRSWQAGGTYRRGLDYIAELRDPVYTDGISTTVSGALSRRLDVSASAGYSTGASAVSRGASAFDTYTGDVRFEYALKRTWAVYAQYLYYYYDFRGSAQLRPGLPPTLERNGVRVGLSLRFRPVGR